jgi:hypothetical protein
LKKPSRLKDEKEEEEEESKQQVTGISAILSQNHETFKRNKKRL